MSLFGRRTPSTFVTPDAFERNLASQLSMTPQTLAQLRQYGVSERSTLRLEYFFYSNSADRASALSAALASMGYRVESRPAAKKREYLVTGWTSPVIMAEVELLAWTESMCRLGLTHDCDFDGWGTNPDQSENESGA